MEGVVLGIEEGIRVYCLSGSGEKHILPPSNVPSIFSPGPRVEPLSEEVGIACRYSSIPEVFPRIEAFDALRSELA